MMITKNTENKKMKLNDEQLDAVQGGSLLDLVGEGIGYLFDDITEKLEKFRPKDGCTGKQVVPGFNVY